MSIHVVLTLLLLGSARGQETKEIATFKGHTLPVMAIAFSPDGTVLASGAGDLSTEPGGEVKLWDVAAQKEKPLLQGDMTGTFSVAFSPDGKILATGEYNQVRLWDLTTGKVLRVLECKAGIASRLAFSPDGTTLATSFRGSFGFWRVPGQVKLWNAKTWQEIASLKEARDVQLTFSPNGQLIVLASVDETIIEIWDASTLKVRSRLEGFNHGVTALAVSPDSRFLACGTGVRHYVNEVTSWEGELTIWDLSAGKRLKTFDGIKGMVNSVTFSPDGKCMAIASCTQSKHNETKLWDFVTGKEQAALKCPEDWVRAVVYSPDGRTLATTSDDKTVKLWIVPIPK